MSNIAAMKGIWPGSLVLFLCVTLFLVFMGQRIANRVEIAEQGATVLMPLVPIGREDLARGELIFLIYDEPEVIAQVRGGGWPDQGSIKVTLDQENVAHSPRLYEGGRLEAAEIVLDYRFGTTGLGRWPSYRRRLVFGDDFFLTSGRPLADYLGARYAVLRVDTDGSSVVVGLADVDAKLIGPDP